MALGIVGGNHLDLDVSMKVLNSAEDAEGKVVSEIAILNDRYLTITFEDGTALWLDQIFWWLTNPPLLADLL